MIRNRVIGRRIGDAPLYIPGEPLYSFCDGQDPRCVPNPNPIYAPGSPQYNAAVAAGAVDPRTGRSYPPYTPPPAVEGPAANLAPGIWNGDCNNPVVADAAGNLAYIAKCYPNTPLGNMLASQQQGGGPLSLNPAAPVAVSSMPTVIGTPNPSGVPWYYWAGGAAAAFFLFKK